MALGSLARTRTAGLLVFLALVTLALAIQRQWISDPQWVLLFWIGTIGAVLLWVVMPPGYRPFENPEEYDE